MNEVIALYPGITNLRLNSVNFQGGVTVNAEVGKPYGEIKGKRLLPMTLTGI